MANQQNKNNFLDQWLNETKNVLDDAIAAEFGIGLDRFKTPSSSTRAKREIQINNIQHQELKKFMGSFYVLCKRRGVIRGEMNWTVKAFEGPPGALTTMSMSFWNSMQTLLSKVESERKKAIKKLGKRRRPRIPNKVAFQIVKLLHHYKKDRAGVHSLEKIMKPNGQADLLVQNITKERANYRIIEITKSLSHLECLLAKATTRYRHREINSRILKLNREIRFYKSFEVKWNPFSVSRNMNDPNWVNQMKQHLIDSILADGEPNIKNAARSKDYQKRKKSLIRDIELGIYSRAKWENNNY